jgi:hypothetical protein
VGEPTSVGSAVEATIGLAMEVTPATASFGAAAEGVSELPEATPFATPVLVDCASSR